MSVSKSKVTLRCVVIASILAVPAAASAHGEHENVAPGIIDPLITHHATLEDEFKLNYFGSRLDTDDVSAQSLSLELAYAFTNLFGIELFLDLERTDTAGTAETGFGGAQLLVPKLSFLRRRDLIMTSYVAVEIPGAGGTWAFAPHLLVDVGLGGRWAVQSNAAVEIETDGAVVLEGNISLARSLLVSRARGTSLAPLVELNAEAPVRGEGAGEVALTVTPGLKLAVGGLHVGAGLQLPLTRARDFDYRVLAQLGYHVAWEELFPR